MPKWQRDATEFVVPVYYDEVKGSKINIPKPILDLLNRPTHIKFAIAENNEITIEPMKKPPKKSKKKAL